jgi:hypothetical protein
LYARPLLFKETIFPYLIDHVANNYATDSEDE